MAGRAFRVVPAALGALLAMAPPAPAQTKTGTTLGQFLLIEPSARLTAIGNAGVAAGAGLDGAYYNPAAAGRISRLEFQLTHINWFAGIRYDYVAAAIPLKSWGIGFATVSSLGSGEIDVRTVTQPLGAPVHDQPGSILQVALQPSALVRFPSSHVSPDPSTPSPHGSDASGAASSSPGTMPPSRATAASVVRLGPRPPSKSGTELGSSSSSNAKGWATIPLHATVLVARSHDRTAADWRCMA